MKILSNPRCFLILARLLDDGADCGVLIDTTGVSQNNLVQILAVIRLSKRVFYSTTDRA